MNSINPHWIVVDIEPSIALARAECLETFRKLPAPKAHAFDVMKDARIARSMYQRDLLRQFGRFLVANLRLAHASRRLRYPSTAYPRGA